MSVFLQTSQPTNNGMEEEEEGQQNVVDDSGDETDMERDNDFYDDGDGDPITHVCETLRQSIQETLCITRTLEVIDDEHQEAWLNVRRCLEKLAGLMSINATHVCMPLCIL